MSSVELWCSFELGYEVLDILVVDAKYAGCRSDGDFILYGSHGWCVDLGSRHLDFIS